MSKIGDNSGASEGDLEADEMYKELMGLSLEEILRQGQKMLFARLVAEVDSGAATVGTKALLAQILKDNGLVMGIPPVPPVVEEPLDLPEFGDPEYGG